MTYKVSGDVYALIGDMGFASTISDIQWSLSLRGHTVLTPLPSAYLKTDEKVNDSVLSMTYPLGYMRILLSNIVFMINKDEYISEQMLKEYVFAKAIGKPIKYYDRTKVHLIPNAYSNFDITGEDVIAMLTTISAYHQSLQDVYNRAKGTDIKVSSLWMCVDSSDGCATTLNVEDEESIIGFLQGNDKFIPTSLKIGRYDNVLHYECYE